MRLSRLCLLPFTLLLMVGCRKDEAIQQYEVTHIDREKIELRIAILPQKKYVWFFDLSGPAAEAQKNEDVFKEMVKTVRFVKKKDGPPITWTEPKGWTKKEPGDRIAAYRIDTAGKPMEMVVTFLPREDYSLLSSLHDWQQEMNIAIADDVDRFIKRDKIGEQEVIWVSMTGLGVHLGQARSRKQHEAFDASREFPFEYEVPAGWEEKPPRDKFAVTLFDIVEKDQVASVTLTATGGELPMHIERWRGQLKLPPLGNEDAAMKLATKIKVAGIDAHKVDVVNPKEPNRIVVVIVPVGGAKWFIRLSGPRELVGRKLTELDSFVGSMRLGAE